MESAEQFFDFAAEVGFTKHMGGIEATEALVELCHIEEGTYVLDVGCGAGTTAAYLVQRHGCRVVGVDILPRMVDRARETAQREGVTDRTEFRVANAQDLPFDDETFDAVITESVAAFPEDKQRAANEYARVTKRGGYVGLNESTWLQPSPPPEIVAWASQEVGAQVKPLTPDEWVALLEGAGLEEVVTRVHHVETRDEAGRMMRRYGCLGMLRVWWRMLRLYVKNAAYRRFLKRIRQGGITPKNLDDYFGYGLYVGRKQE